MPLPKLEKTRRNAKAMPVTQFPADESSNRVDEAMVDENVVVRDENSQQKVHAYFILTCGDGDSVAVDSRKDSTPILQALKGGWDQEILLKLYRDAIASSDAPVDRRVVEFYDNNKSIATEIASENAAMDVAEASQRAEPSKSGRPRVRPVRRIKTLTRSKTRRATSVRVMEAGPGVQVIPRARESPVAFQISDREKVGKLLDECLRHLQQHVNKRIAKAWIKGICPRKQAKYPYRDKLHKNEHGVDPPPPAWWPVDECHFTEPDHVTRDMRVALCRRLLRLRPSPEQLKQWNQFAGDSKPMRTHTSGCWTAFLRDLAPPSTADEVEQDGDGKADRRRRLIERMYQIAEMEEDYENGCRDGTDLIQPLDAELIGASTKAATAPRKRTRRSSTVSAEDDAVVFDDPEQNAIAPIQPKKVKHTEKSQPSRRRSMTERRSSLSDAEGSMDEADRRAAVPQQHQRSQTKTRPENALTTAMDIDDKPAVTEKPVVPKFKDSIQSFPGGGQMFVTSFPNLPPHHSYQHSSGYVRTNHIPASVNTSFTSEDSQMSSFTAENDFAFPSPEPWNEGMPFYQAGHPSGSHFDVTNPSSPAFTPAGFMDNHAKDGTSHSHFGYPGLTHPGPGFRAPQYNPAATINPHMMAPHYVEPSYPPAFFMQRPDFYRMSDAQQFGLIGDPHANFNRAAYPFDGITPLPNDNGRGLPFSHSEHVPDHSFIPATLPGESDRGPTGYGDNVRKRGWT